MNKSVLWTQIQMILDSLSVLINRVASLVKKPTGKHQMLVTDAKGESKWEERTHWAESGEEILLDNVELEFVQGPNVFFIGEPLGLEVGEKYKVIWNGTEYVCTAVEIMFQEMQAVAVGNVNGDTNDPFVVVEPPSGAIGADIFAIVDPMDTTVLLNLTIKHVTDTVHKIDPKYLPDGIGGVADWNASEGEPGHVLNRTHWVETVVGYVILPCTPTFIEDFGAFVTTEPPLVKPSVGTEYTVNWNGTEYQSTAFEDDSFGMLMTTIGNLAAVGKDDTGEPFLIVFPTDEAASGTGFYTQIMALDGAAELSLSISGTSTIIHQIDKKYLPPAEVNNTNIRNGLAVGSLRSATAQEENLDIGYVMGTSAAAIGEGAKAGGARAIALGSGSEASGSGSVAIGLDATATGDVAIAMYGGTASGFGSIACGFMTEASAQNAVAIGHKCTASANYSFAEGQGTTAGGESSHAEGAATTAEGNYAHAEGSLTHATGVYSHAEGFGTYANGDHQHVQGKYNIEDTGGEFAHIVGNGADHYNRSNAHTLDWDGNAWFAGTVEGTAIILPSPGGKRFKITVDDSGTISATEVS